jgi:hypothetical protein
MNGATAEPWLRAMRPPKKTIMLKMGNSQYFLRWARKRRNSERKLMGGAFGGKGRKELKTDF